MVYKRAFNLAEKVSRDWFERGLKLLSRRRVNERGPSPESAGCRSEACAAGRVTIFLEKGHHEIENFDKLYLEAKTIVRTLSCKRAI